MVPQGLFGVPGVLRKFWDLGFLGSQQRGWVACQRRHALLEIRQGLRVGDLEPSGSFGAMLVELPAAYSAEVP